MPQLLCKFRPPNSFIFSFSQFSFPSDSWTYPRGQEIWWHPKRNLHCARRKCGAAWRNSTCDFSLFVSPIIGHFNLSAKCTVLENVYSICSHFLNHSLHLTSHGIVCFTTPRSQMMIKKSRLNNNYINKLLIRGPITPWLRCVSNIDFTVRQRFLWGLCTVGLECLFLCKMEWLTSYMAPSKSPEWTRGIHLILFYIENFWLSKSKD